MNPNLPDISVVLAVLHAVNEGWDFDADPAARARLILVAAPKTASRGCGLAEAFPRIGDLIQHVEVDPMLRFRSNHPGHRRYEKGE